MTSTPSYPRRAAISKAVAVDSGYTEAVDSATFASGMQTGSAMPTGYGVRWVVRGAPIRRCGVRHGRVRVICGCSRPATESLMSQPRAPLGRLRRPHVIQLAQDYALPERPRTDWQDHHAEQVQRAVFPNGAGEELACSAPA